MSMASLKSSTLGPDSPTNGELIDLFLKVEKENFNDESVLCYKFKELCPHISLGRPRRFFDTVQRIVASTRPSSTGRGALSGSPLVSYRKRKWMPRVRNRPTGMN